jgi:hypothetical protein
VYNSVGDDGNASPQGGVLRGLVMYNVSPQEGVSRGLVLYDSVEKDDDNTDNHVPSHYTCCTYLYIIVFIY